MYLFLFIIVVKNGQFNVAELRILKGDDIEARTTHTGSTPLHLASGEGHLDLMSLLIEKGADVESVLDSGGYTSICVAVIFNQPRAVELLIAKGCNFNIRTKTPPCTRFETPLQLAEGWEYTEIVKILKAAKRRFLRLCTLKPPMAFRVPWCKGSEKN